MLITSIFSFSHNVFNPIKDRYHHLTYSYFVICKCFQYLGQSNILSFYQHFHLSKNKFKFFSNIYFVVCKFFQFGPVQYLSFVYVAYFSDPYHSFTYFKVINQDFNPSPNDKSYILPN